MPSILIVDDEPQILQTLTTAYASTVGVDVVVARTATEGLACAADRMPDVVILDMRLPDIPGLEVFRKLQAMDARVPVIFVTVATGADAVISALREGAFDYIFKPFDATVLQQTLAAALEASRLARVPAAVGEEPTADETADRLVGRCEAMKEVYKAIGRTAAQDVTVLVNGESGTGKELVARAIYQHSRRADRPFLALNCAAIPEALLESELFGHEKGAFTGAERRRIGKFEQCAGGTLFLDEIGDMPLVLQGKLLRVLQDGRFERLGSNETLSADVRLIAATHRHLPDLVRAGRFRQDLYFRLNVVRIDLPPLRDRAEDVSLLAEHYLARFSRSFGKDVRAIAPEAMTCLVRHSWPGNVRELQSVLKQALLTVNGTVLTIANLPAGVDGHGSADGVANTNVVADWLGDFVRERLEAGSNEVWSEVARRVDEALLPIILDHTRGNQQKAAAILGVARQTLRTRLRELGISPRGGNNSAI